MWAKKTFLGEADNKSLLDTFVPCCELTFQASELTIPDSDLGEMSWKAFKDEPWSGWSGHSIKVRVGTPGSYGPELPKFQTVHIHIACRLKASQLRAFRKYLEGAVKKLVNENVRELLHYDVYGEFTLSSPLETSFEAVCDTSK